MIRVSLLDLVLVKDARHLWPDDFHGLVTAAEEDPDDRLRFGVIADWCDEQDEGVYGAAWRWLHARPFIDSPKSGVQVYRHRASYGEYHRWELGNLPGWVNNAPTSHRRFEQCDQTLAALVADFAYQLDAVKKELA